MINPQVMFINGGVYVECEHCGKESEVRRSSAFFCDTKCKNAYHNKKRKRAKDIKLAFQSLETLILNMPLQGDSPEWDALVNMKEQISAAMWKVQS